MLQFTPKLFQLFCWVALLLLGASLGAQIKFYDEAEYRGLFFETNPTGECINLPTYGHNHASSVNASGNCLILYQQLDCNSSGLSLRVAPDMDHNWDFNNYEFDNRAKSFQTCNEAEGGEKVRVGLYSTYNTEATNLEGAGGLRVQYEDICGCTNLPYYAQFNISSLDNHGNCIMIYKDEDCRGGSWNLRGGKSIQSQNLSLINFDKSVRSINLCSDRQWCLKLNATLFKFELTSQDPTSPFAESEYVAMTSKTVLFNNGSATVTQEYIATKTISEQVTVTRDSSLTEMSTVSTVDSVQTSTSVGFPFFFKQTTVRTLTNAYTFTTNSTSSEGEEFTSEETREFSVSQKIEIPPCTRYEIDSFIKMTENFPVEYVLYTYVSGIHGEKRLTAQELRPKLISLEYVEDHDEYTVIAKSTNVLKANFGVEAVTDGSGEPIEGCVQQSGNRTEL
ncbi:hypothetical protein Ocin01_17386 [Orchesella cincta]|uniref:Uncharacterized protein n=1 Tax=Orchesella cincta TaxID=48709 RepID=A0A1D2M8I2_ORCCI|nr:hypothetical protein Ocin01_17386 [Orchesella cincta]